jgi:hypothetical protein
LASIPSTVAGGKHGHAALKVQYSYDPTISSLMLCMVIESNPIRSTQPTLSLFDVSHNMLLVLQPVISPSPQSA